jgi:predicted nucleic acid-binding protein
MLIVCDSSPLIALAKCDKLNILDSLFDIVLIPEQVYHEFSVSGKPEAAVIAAWARGKVDEPGEANLSRANALSLGPGETAAIALYWEKSADFLLIDERKGRRIASQNGIKIIGIAGILLAAKNRGLISAVKPFLDLLLNASYYISDSLYRTALQSAKERPVREGREKNWPVLLYFFHTVISLGNRLKSQCYLLPSDAYRISLI